MAECLFCLREIKDDARFCPFCGRDSEEQPSQHHLPPGTLLHEKYRVGGALGEGGFGITYVGRDETLNVRVAIKEYYPQGFVNRVASVSTQVSCNAGAEKADFYQKGKQRFLQEARVLAKFSGAKGIVNVRDYFEENNTAYIVMEYLDGVTLKKYLKQTGRLSPEKTLRLLTPVMESLRLLHAENVIHRDISPDNIILVNGEVKLLDFGAARSVGGDQKSLSVMLKPGYAPEEQYRSKGNQGPWTDVYALCATMYRCITGVRPEESTNRIWNDTLQPPSTLGVAISPQFEHALMRGLVVKAEGRWQSVDDLLRALQAEPGSVPAPKEKPASQNQPRAVPAEPSTQPEPKKKKPNGITLALAIFAALAAVILIVIGILWANKNRSPNGGTDAENLKVGDVYTFGSYEQDNDASNGKEAIEWLVLKIEDGDALLISKYALDCKPFNTEYTDVTWESCSLRRWLKNDFYSAAFDDGEKGRIQNKKVQAEANPDYNFSDPGNDTTDKVFLLSINDAKTYFSDGTRKCEPTAYAVEKGAVKGDLGFCWWWLRSPGGINDDAALVVDDGTVYTKGTHVFYDSNAVRPAVWIRLSEDKDEADASDAGTGTKTATEKTLREEDYYLTVEGETFQFPLTLGDLKAKGWKKVTADTNNYVNDEENGFLNEYYSTPGGRICSVRICTSGHTAGDEDAYDVVWLWFSTSNQIINEPLFYNISFHAPEGTVDLLDCYYSDLKPILGEEDYFSGYDLYQEPIYLLNDQRVDFHFEYDGISSYDQPYPLGGLTFIDQSIPDEAYSLSGENRIMKVENGELVDITE